MPRVREHKWPEFAQLACALYSYHQPTHIAVDCETTGLLWQDRPFGVSVSWHGPERMEHFWFEVEEEYPRELLQWLLDEHTSRHGTFVFFHQKFDVRMLVNAGLWDDTTPHECVDVMPAVALLDPTGEHKLKVAARKYLGVSTNQENLVKRARKELKLTKDDGYWPLPREVVVPYALRDTEFTLRLHDLLMPMISERGLQEAFDKEMRIVAEFLRMEQRGLKVLPEVVKESIRESDALIGAAKAEIETIVGRKVGKAKKKVRVSNGVSEKTGRELWRTIEVPEDFNPSSPAQILEVFKGRGVRLSSTESKVLEKVDDPLVGPLMALRSEDKLRNTYLVPLLKEMDDAQIIHPNLNSNGTATGRVSSGAVRET